LADAKQGFTAFADSTLNAIKAQQMRISGAMNSDHRHRNGLQGAATLNSGKSVMNASEGVAETPQTTAPPANAATSSSKAAFLGPQTDAMNQLANTPAAPKAPSASPQAATPTVGQTVPPGYISVADFLTFAKQNNLPGSPGIVPGTSVLQPGSQQQPQVVVVPGANGGTPQQIMRLG